MGIEIEVISSMIIKTCVPLIELRLDELVKR